MNRINVILTFTSTFLVLFLGVNSCKNASDQSEHIQSSEQLNEYLNTYWEQRLELFPLEATAIGDHRYNDRLPVSISEVYRDTLRQFYQRFLSGIKEIEVVSEEDVMSKEIFIYEMESNLSALKFPTHLMPITQFWSFTLEFPQLGSGSGNQPFKSVKDYDNFLNRMRLFPNWVDTAIQNMKRGIVKGYTLPHPLAAKVIPQLKQLLKDDPAKSIFFQPIEKMPDSISVNEQKRLRIAYTTHINEYVLPAYRRLLNFFEKEYLPTCRLSHGYSSLPEGKAWYQQLIQQYTTTNLSPDSIYRLGLQEVDSLGQEMKKVMNGVNFKGSLPDFFAYLNSDPQFFPFHSAEEVLDSFRAIQNIEDKYLETIFESKPQTGFEIRQTEAYRAASASAEYNAGSQDGSRPGVFYVPILNPQKFNIVGMETLFLHEAIPGHHYQISLQQENKRLPAFRKFLSYSAYAEGWALYTETLGKELGLYSNPYQYFGHLSDAMHRAIRLVVDVGLHSKNMSREEAIKYMKTHERVSDEEAVAEIERYMAIPGQALSYKIGQLTISRMKDKYQKLLGSKFDLSAFHTCLLEGGNMPLEVLEKKLARWAKSY